MPNIEDKRLPNHGKTPEQLAAEGWNMIGNDPRAWRNSITGEKIDTRGEYDKNGNHESSPEYDGGSK